MIPKVIHYCWFGGNELPELAVECIDSWKKYFPNYEIKRWDESNFNLNVCDYVREAYEKKKWAFVSDYARFWILYHEGGIYFDTDVEVVLSFDDILKEGAYFGLEDRSSGLSKKDEFVVAPGLGMAVEKNNSFYKKILDDYEKRHFVLTNGTLDMTTVVVRVTEILLEGLQESKKNTLDFSRVNKINGFNIYPSEYFCPLSYSTGEMKKTKNTHSIHHYTATWKTHEEQQMLEIERYFKNIPMGKVFATLLNFPLRVKQKIRKKLHLID